MRFLALAALPLSPAAALAVVPVQYPPPVLTEVAVNIGAGDQYDPHVSGDWAAYTSDDSMRYYRFSTGPMRESRVAVTEGNSGFRNAIFTVSLSDPSAQPVTVWYYTWFCTAFPLADFIPNIGRITIAPQQRQAAITVKVRGETVVEGDETFFVVLLAPHGGVIVDGVGQGTIVNDDH